MLNSKWSLLCVGLLLALPLGNPVESSSATPLQTAVVCGTGRFGDLFGDSFRDPSAAIPAALDASRIRLLNWNIQKSSRPGWLADLRKFGGHTDLLLLQEATLEENLPQAMGPDFHAVFAPGYRSSQYRSGVMTLSRVPARTTKRYKR